MKDLRDHLRAKLPEFMVPSHFVEIREFPLTPNLKIDRKALPPPGATPVPVVQGGAVPSERRGGLEQQLISIWQEVLGVPRVGVHDDFFRPRRTLFANHTVAPAYQPTRRPACRNRGSISLFYHPQAGGVPAGG